LKPHETVQTEDILRWYLPEASPPLGRDILVETKAGYLMVAGAWSLPAGAWSWALLPRRIG